MACLEGGELERNFLEALQDSETYSISSDHLAVYDSGGQTVLEFDAVYLR
jgi:heat shock protein HslJ